MNIKYFCAPRLREYLSAIKPGILDFVGESPLIRPLAIRTTYSGLAFDFNMGFRLQIPAGNWHVKILDYDSKVVFFDDDISDTVLISLEKFFVRWQFMLWLDGAFVFEHTFDPAGWKVHVNYPASGMGDRIIFFLMWRLSARNGIVSCLAPLIRICRKL